MDTRGLNPKTRELLALFSEAQNDSKKMAALMEAPLDAMAKLGIEVDPKFSNAVAQGLRSAALITNPDGGKSTAKRSVAKRVSAKGIGAKKKSVSVGATNNFEQSVHVSAELWGIVVKLDHKAVAELPKGEDGIDTIAAALAAACEASVELGPIGIAVILGLAYWGAILSVYLLILPSLDKGKGVYLTISWPQIAIGVASGGILAMAMMPVPTTVI